jgi:hypothetical protein
MPDQGARRSPWLDDADIRMGYVLLGRVDNNATPPSGSLNHAVRRFERQAGMIALAAQVKQDKVLNGVASRPSEDLSDEFRTLIIGQMARLAEDSRDQVGRPARGSLQGDVVIEFDSQNVDIRDRLDHCRIPAAGI